MRGLDLGAGDGMLGVLLDTFGHEMTLSDFEDWRMDAAKSLPFVQADCCDALPIPNDASTSFSVLMPSSTFQIRGAQWMSCFELGICDLG